MNREFSPCCYIMANRKNGTLYIGVTSNLMQRVAQHREGFYPGFSRDKATKILVWFEQHETMEQAILREKRIKKWNRQWKINLIEADNKEWLDLALDFGFKRLPSLVIGKR